MPGSKGDRSAAQKRFPPLPGLVPSSADAPKGRAVGGKSTDRFALNCPVPKEVSVRHFSTDI